MSLLEESALAIETRANKELDDLIDEYLEDLSLADVIALLAAKLEELREEEADHERTAQTGAEAEGN